MTKPTLPEPAIIRTRLAPPRVGSAPVSRDKLLQRLNSRAGCKLHLVLGPAGSGKTMLLAQWRKLLADQGAHVAWYNLGTDDDVTQVGTYIVESLRSAKLDIRTDDLHLFNRSGGKSRNSFIASLIDDLLDCSGDIYLIIDDLHHAAAVNIFQLLDALLEALPDNVHLVFGSRARPPLNLVKLQTQDQLAELDFKDLRFDLEETGKFVAAQGLSLSPAHIRRLHEMSDGWAAGLQLLLFSLRKEQHIERFFERQATKPSVSQEGALVSYLESNVANYLSTEELDFLCSISVCGRFTRELCESLSGNLKAGELLKKFENEQLFLLPIDAPEADTWYRFHRLFNTFLQSRLEQRGRAEIKRLCQKAAHWFAGRRLYIEALRYANEAGDIELLADLIERSARRMSAAGQFRQLTKWCDLLPKATLRKRLSISLNLAWGQIYSGHIDAFQDILEGILHHPKHTAPSVHYEVQLLRASGCAAVDDSDGIVGIVEPMLQQPPPADPFLLSLLSGLAASGFTYAGRFAEAREAVRFFYKSLSPIQQHQSFLADLSIGNSYLQEGRVRDALAHLLPFKEEIILGGKIGPDAIANSMGSLCDALYQLNRVEDAREMFEAYEETIGTAELPDGILNGYRIRAQLQQMSGDAQAAFQTLQRLEEIGIQRRLERLVAWSLYDQVVLSLRASHVTSREELLHRLSQLAEKFANYEHCSWAQIPMVHGLAVAENALHQADHNVTLQLVEAAERLCLKIGRTDVLMRLGFMRCIAKLAAGSQISALSEGLEWVQKAAEHGALRTLADLGTIAHPLAKLLVSRAESEGEHEVLRVALESGPSGNGRSQPSDYSKTLSEPLTAREQEVLELLGKGLSAKGIGRKLDISLATAKWHLKNAYGKLQAGSREDALAKARRHRIIS